jgi:hypothetical protein
MNIEELIALVFGGGAIVITIIATVIGTICTTLPFAAIGWYIYRTWKRAKVVEAQSQSWLSTAGIIVKSRVEVSGGEHTSVSPRIVYEYGVGGQTYQNDSIRPGDHFISFQSGSAYEVVDRYPVGTAVEVFYNPANPAESALER